MYVKISVVCCCEIRIISFEDKRNVFSSYHTPLRPHTGVELTLTFPGVTATGHSPLLELKPLLLN